MTTPIYSAFDPAALGQGLDLTQTNTIVTVAQTTDVNRTARALYGKSSGAWYAEFMVWGTGTLAGYASVGIVDAQASMATYVGGDAHGWGYRIAEGKIYNNNASIATVAAGAVGDVIGVSLVFDSSGNAIVTWTNGTAVLSTQTLAPGTYFLAATVAGVQAGDLQCLLNCGQRGFEYGNGAGGWYIVPPLLDTIYLASGEYITAPTDSPASAPFDSSIVNGQSFAVSHQLNFGVWKGSSVTPATASLQVANPGGQYDSMLPADMTNRPIMLQELAGDGDAYSTATGAANMLITDAKANDENTLTLTLKDSLALLDLPLQNHLILPNAEANAVNQPWPFVLGAARNVPLTLIDAKANTYAVSDVPVVGFGYVRDKGDPFDPNASPPDYTIAAGRNMITLGSQAQGMVTGDFSSVGGGTLPTSATDIFGGAGNPFTGTINATPTGWSQKAGWGTAAAKLIAGNQVQFSAAAPTLRLTAGATMLAGRSYRVTLTVVGATSSTTSPADQSISIGIARAMTSPSNWAWKVPGVAGTYSTVITNTGVDFEPILAVYNDSVPGFQGDNVIVKGFSLLLIADTYVPSAILPIKLADFVAAIMAKAEKNGIRIPYSRADLDAIDTATGFAGIGYAAIGATTARQALDMALASYCACAWMDSTGTLRFTRLALPENETATLSLATGDWLNDMAYAQDAMTGLTTQVGYRYNWQTFRDSDFVTDFIDVPSSVRRAFSRQCQGVAATAAPLAPIYARAVFNEPFYSLLDRQEDAQALADYLGKQGGRKRGFYTIDLPHNTMTMGQIVNLTHNRYGLDAGLNTQVVTILDRQLDEIDTVTFRG